MTQQPSNPSPPSPPTAAADPPADDFFSILPLIGLAFLTYNTISSICRSIHDPWIVAFVSVSYVDLLLLYYCFRLVERTPPSDFRRRERLTAAVWSLIFILAVMFAYHVALIMPLAIAVIIWVLLAITVAGGFYVLFLYKEAPEEEEEVKPAQKKSSNACDKC